MKKYGQLYNGKIIYIFETDLDIDELYQYFDPSTVWFDVTDLEGVDIGWIQSFNKFGQMVIVPPIDRTNDTPNQSFRYKFRTGKVYMYMALDELAQSNKYIDFNDCISYIADETNPQGMTDAKKVMRLRNALEGWLASECSMKETAEEIKSLDFEAKIKELNFTW